MPRTLIETAAVARVRLTSLLSLPPQGTRVAAREGLRGYAVILAFFVHFMWFIWPFSAGIEGVEDLRAESALRP
jgi:hypothetical protein